MNSILCPHCKKQVEISEALSHQLRDQILLEVDGKHKEELEKIRLESEARAAKKAEEALGLKLKNSQEEIEETKRRNNQLQEQLSELLKKLRAMEQKDSERELEMQKQLLKERELMEMEISKSEQEKARLEKMELQKQLDDTKKALQDAQRKAQQSSQQLQGEVLELDLEMQLKECFPTDEITPVPKGIDGADITQKVRNKYGHVAGTILWETKRTKAWNQAWLGKLREDVRTLGANCAIIVSEILPQGIETFGIVDQVWVTCQKYALPLAQALRVGILHVAIAKSTSANKDEKLEALYQYLTNASFKYRFEAQVEAIIELRQDFEAEQRTMTRLWKKKEMQLQRMTKNVASLYGELQGILGSALPAIQGLEVDHLIDIDGISHDNPGNNRQLAESGRISSTIELHTEDSIASPGSEQRQASFSNDKVYEKPETATSLF